MYRLLMLLLLQTIVGIYSQAQDSGFLPGYIITNSNDTVHGLVKYINQVPYRVLIDIKFKANEKSKSTIYPPGTIIGYVADGKIFHSLKTPDGTDQFMELVIDGYIKLYRSTVTAFGVPEYGPANTTTDFLLKTGETNLFYVSKGKFKEKLSDYLADNPSLADKIRNGEYKKKDIEEIVTEYNEAKKRTN